MTMHRSVSAAVCLLGLASALLVSTGNPAVAGKTSARTNCLVGETGGNIGVSVDLFGYISGAEADHTYELRYQIRLHHKKGTAGPLLATRAYPQGRAYTVATDSGSQGGKGFVDLNATVDIVRKDLREVVNFPSQKGHQEVLLRIEPQIYDVTAKKYLTKPQTEAIILVVHLWSNRVSHIEFFGDWMVKNCFKTTKMLEKYNTLDNYNAYQNFIPRAFEGAISYKHLTDDKRIALINACPREFIDGKNNLRRVLDDQRKSAGSELKEAIDRKLK